MELYLKLVDHLLVDNQIPFWVYQRYTVDSRWDVDAIQKSPLGYGKSRSAIENELIRDLGGVSIPLVLRATAELQKSTISLEQFQRMYEFGKYPNVIDWLTEIEEQTEFLLTKQDLFKYVARSTGDEFKVKDTTVRFRANVY